MIGILYGCQRQLKLLMGTIREHSLTACIFVFILFKIALYLSYILPCLRYQLFSFCVELVRFELSGWVEKKFDLRGYDNRASKSLQNVFSELYSVKHFVGNQQIF